MSAADYAVSPARIVTWEWPVNDESRFDRKHGPDLCVVNFFDGRGEQIVTHPGPEIVHVGDGPAAKRVVKAGHLCLAPVEWVSQLIAYGSSRYSDAGVLDDAATVSHSYNRHGLWSAEIDYSRCDHAQHGDPDRFGGCSCVADDYGMAHYIVLKLESVDGKTYTWKLYLSVRVVLSAVFGNPTRQRGEEGTLTLRVSDHGKPMYVGRWPD